jgi:Tfp pilus assembly protein PilN
MVTINLLPWRAQLHLYQKRMLKKILWCSFLSIVVVNLIVYGVLLHQAHHVRSRLAVIKRELNRYSALQTRMDARRQHEVSVSAMKSLLAEQMLIKNFFVTLGAPYHNDICFTGLVRDQQKITFYGHTRSATDLSQFLHAWRLSALFSDVHIERLERSNNQAMQFRFQAFFHAV